MALVIGHITGDADSPSPSSGPLPAVTVSAPPHAAAETAACTKVLEKLPVMLGKLAPRVVHPTPDTPFVAAWGDPAVIWRCGVDRPADLTAGSTAEYQSGGNPATGPWYDLTSDGGSNVWTTVDRAAYISIEVPAQYGTSTVIGPAPVVELSKIIAAALPAVCSTDSSVIGADPDKGCARRP